jgi:Uma2 family endonuclease
MTALAKVRRSKRPIRSAVRPLPAPAAYQFSVTDFYRMAVAGIFSDDARVELLEGEIVMMPPTDPEHASSTHRSHKRVDRMLADRYEVRCQQPLSLGPKSEPLPDVAVVKAQSYKTQHPKGSDTFLVIEVANSSLKDDLERKRLIYAKAGIPEYWVLDLPASTLHVFTKLKRGDYTESRELDANEMVTATSIKGLKVKVSELLP